MGTAVRVRPATLADAGAIQSIYGHHALHGFGTFEEAPPPLDDITARITAVLDHGLPYVVAELDGAVNAERKTPLACLGVCSTDPPA